MANVMKEAKKYRAAHPKSSWDNAIKQTAKLMKRGAKVGAKPKKRKTTVTVKVGAKKKAPARKKPAAKKTPVKRKAAAPKKTSSKSTNMSHKKRHHKVGATHHRRRRVGGVRTGKANTAVMMMLGGVAGGVLATAMQRVMPNANSKVIGGIQAAVGIVGTMMMKKPILQGIALGVGTAGTVALAHQFGVLKGVEDMMGGISNYQTLAGLPNEQIFVDAPYEMQPQMQQPADHVGAVG